jgi:hypothetical protein
LCQGVRQQRPVAGRKWHDTTHVVSRTFTVFSQHRIDHDPSLVARNGKTVARLESWSPAGSLPGR